MRKNKFTHFRRLRDNGNHRRIKLIQLQPADQKNQAVDYDHSLFPIKLHPAYLEERFDFIEVPSILRNKFDDLGLQYLGEIQGLNSSDFLFRPGFGTTCFQVLCEFLSDIQQKGPTKLPIVDLEKLHKQELPDDTLKFPIDKLNLPKILKLRICDQFGVFTIGGFLDALEKGKLSKKVVGLNTMRLIEHELSILMSVENQQYLADYSLEQQSFLKLLENAKQGMDWKEKIVFDSRFLPMENDFSSLEEIAQNINLSIEGVRRIDKKLIKRFQGGNLKEIGGIIRRRAIDIFKSINIVLSFESFLADNFFKGITPSETPLPPPINFLKKVFYSTFNVGRTGISLKTYTRGESFI